MDDVVTDYTFLWIAFSIIALVVVVLWVSLMGKYGRHDEGVKFEDVLDKMAGRKGKR